jgi:hypothetical protein
MQMFDMAEMQKLPSSQAQGMGERPLCLLRSSLKNELRNGDRSKAAPNKRRIVKIGPRIQFEKLDGFLVEKIGRNKFRQTIS